MSVRGASADRVMVDDPASRTTDEDREKLKVWWSETLSGFAEAQRRGALRDLDARIAATARKVHEALMAAEKDALFDALNGCITVRDYRVVKG